MVLKIGVANTSGFYGETDHREYFGSFRKISLFETDIFEDKIFNEVEILSLRFIYVRKRSYKHPTSSVDVAINFDYYPVLIYPNYHLSLHGKLLPKDFECRGLESRTYQQLIYRVLSPLYVGILKSLFILKISFAVTNI